MTGLVLLLIVVLGLLAAYGALRRTPWITQVLKTGR